MTTGPRARPNSEDQEMWSRIKAGADRFRGWWHRDLTTAMDRGQRELSDRIARLEECLTLPRPEERVAEEPRPADPPPTPSPFGWPQEDRQRLEDQGLFVVGCARSGTTVLNETLNLSPEVYLLGEAMLYHEAFRADFVGFHDRRHAGYGNIRYKGHYPPRAGGPDENGFDLLRRLAARYRYVGEKVAIGPWLLTQLGVEDVDRFFAFQAAHFFHSRYVVITRDPREVVWSMAVKWPTVPVSTLLALWAVCHRAGLELAFTFPRTLVMTHDRLDEQAVGRLGRELGIELAVPPGRFDREFQNSALGDGPLPAALAEYRQPLTELVSLYQDLKSAFDPDTFRYCGRENPRTFAHKACERASELAGRLLQNGQGSARLTG